MTQKLKIVLIDDDIAVLNALSLLLRAFGHWVSEFSQPELAVQTLIDKKFECDLVICDIRMPVLDGFQVLERVITERPELTCVLISGHATEEDVARARGLGAKEVLIKPFSPAILKEILAQYGEKINACKVAC